MKRFLRIISLLLVAAILPVFTASCQSEDEKIHEMNVKKYGDFDSTGMEYDYFLPDYVQVCDYTKLEVPNINLAPTTEMIKNNLTHIESLYCPRENSPDRPAREGDVAEIGMKCTFADNGEVYSLLTKEVGSDMKGQAFVVGTQYFYTDAIDKAVIGMREGETKNITFTLPDPYYKDYYNSGRTLNMEIYLIYIDEVDYSVVNEDFWMEHTQATAGGEETNVRDQIAKDLKEMMEGYKVFVTWNYICDHSKLLKVPEKEYNEICENKKSADRAAAEEAKQTMTEYILDIYGYDNFDDYEAYIKEYAENKCFEEMILLYIIRCDNIEMPDDYYQSEILKMVEKYELKDVSDAESFLDYYYGLDNVKRELTFQYAQQTVAESASVRDDITTIYSDELNKSPFKTDDSKENAETTESESK